MALAWHKLSDAERFISPRFTVADWKRLDLSKADSPGWRQAVEIFRDRMNGRFLNPIEAIRKHGDLRIAEFSGFAIIALDCLLIETLVQFHRGKDKTTGPHVNAFGEFFQGSTHFKSHFDTREKAKRFYEDFRCGLLHQAQTKRRSLILYGLETMVQLAVPNNVDEGLVIDRNLFHDALVREIDDYAGRVQDPQSQVDHKLRKRFVDKFSFITR